MTYDEKDVAGLVEWIDRTTPLYFDESDLRAKLLEIRAALTRRAEAERQIAEGDPLAAALDLLLIWTKRAERAEAEVARLREVGQRFLAAAVRAGFDRGHISDRPDIYAKTADEAEAAAEEFSAALAPGGKL